MKKFINLARSIKDYIVEYENIHKLFMMPKKEIKISKKNKSIAKLEKETFYSESLFKRLRSNFLGEIYDSGGHWKDIYQNLDIANLIKNLTEKDNKFFYEVISKPHLSDIHHGFGDIS